MKHAYNPLWLENLLVVKEARTWLASQFITPAQFENIKKEYASDFYHPNFMIRILLFLAAVIAISGLTGILVLMFSDLSDEPIGLLMLIYGLASFVFLEKFLVGGVRHFKSGVNEAVLYHAAGFTIAGLTFISDGDEYAIAFFFLFVCSFAALRYLDLVSTSVAFLSFCFLVFRILYDGPGSVQQFIPLVFIILFTPIYIFVRASKQKQTTGAWHQCIVVLEVFSLICICAAGNYLVVREMSVSLLDLYVEEGQDIPLAFVFYALTAIIPLIYLYAGIRLKDIVLLRVSLILLAFAVFTFKYYFSMGHHEVTYTIGGAILVVVAVVLFRYLKKSRNGYTAENVLKEKWADANPEAFVMSQTLGGNRVASQDGFAGKGGGFGGGGSGADY